MDLSTKFREIEEGEIEETGRKPIEISDLKRCK